MAVPYYEALPMFGPFLVGAFLNAILYGVCLVQCYVYYQTYKKDAKRVRYLVLYLFVMETWNTIINFGLIFEPLVLNFGNPQSFIVSPTTFPLDAISTVLISTPVQFFAAWRIYVIGQSIVMPLIIVFFGFCSLVGGSALSVLVSFNREWASFGQFAGAPVTWLTSSAVADVLITITLCLSLYRRKTGMKATDDRVSKIVRLTIQTGLLTTIFALLDVTISMTIHRISLNFAWDLPLSKLYTNSLLSTLNARDGLNDNITVPSSNLGGDILTEQNMSGRGTRLSSLVFRRIDVAGTRIDEVDLEVGSVESLYRKDSRSG